jgi:hypothetical protein
MLSEYDSQWLKVSDTALCSKALVAGNRAIGAARNVEASGCCLAEQRRP